MPPDKDDVAYLWDMLRYSRSVVDSLRSITFEHYLKDETLRLATERRIEIIGEAARHVSRPFQENHPEIPWRVVAAQRHILAHEYGEIKQDRIWRVATIHIPDLITQLEPLVPKPSPGDSLK